MSDLRSSRINAALRSRVFSYWGLGILGLGKILANEVSGIVDLFYARENQASTVAENRFDPANKTHFPFVTL